MWENEHGPRGTNLGWSLTTHGINYSGFKISEAGGTTLADDADPIIYW